MTCVGKHSGAPMEEPPAPARGPRLLVLAGGITAAIVAWGFLVWEAVDFGSQARNGEAQAWFFLFLAALGATACMFVMLILCTKTLATLRGDPPVTRTTVSGGRRAAR